MRSIHRQLPGGRATAWRTLLTVAALSAVAALPGAGLASAPPGMDEVLLGGPTGSRAGAPLADDASLPDAASLTTLDTFGRDPALTISTTTDEGWVSWQVEAVPATDSAATPVSLATGLAELPIDRVDLTAPAPGDWLVTAALLSDTDGASGTWAWRLVIPDRSLPDAMPAPDLVLFGGGETVVAVRGSGCYVGSCGDIGREPPVATLPRLRLDRPDEPIALTLSDGSGVAAVHVTAQRLDVKESDPVTILETGGLSANVVLVPPPASSGAWKLTLFVRFTDGRGDQVGYVRVVVPE